MATTIKDIAKATHLTPSTVSRALSNKGKLSQKTKNKILKTAKKLNYHKNINAVDLVTQSSHIINILAPSLETNSVNEMIKGLEEEARKYNYETIIIHTQNRQNFFDQKKALQIAISRHVKGIAIISTELTKENQKILLNSGIPSIFIGTSSIKNKFPFINTNDFEIGYKAAIYLLKKGYQKIAFVGIDKNSYMGQKRIQGYQKAFKDFHLKAKSSWIKPGNFTYQDGLNAIKDFGKKSAVNAVIAASDLVAIGVLNQCLTYSLKVPQDLAIISLDGTQLDDIVHPEITSIIQPFKAMGQEGIKELLNIKEPTYTNTNQYLSFKIKKQQSA